MAPTEGSSLPCSMPASRRFRPAVIRRCRRPRAQSGKILRGRTHPARSGPVRAPQDDASRASDHVQCWRDAGAGCRPDHRPAVIRRGRRPRAQSGKILRGRMHPERSEPVRAPQDDASGRVTACALLARCRGWMPAPQIDSARAVVAIPVHPTALARAGPVGEGRHHVFGAANSFAGGPGLRSSPLITPQHQRGGFETGLRRRGRIVVALEPHPSFPRAPIPRPACASP